MSDYKKALIFQKALVDSTHDQQFGKSVAAKMLKAGMNNDETKTTLAMVLYMIATPTLYYFPRDSFDILLESVKAFPDRDRYYLDDILPSDEGMLVFEDDLLFSENAKVAYSAVIWRKSVNSYALAERDVLAQTTALLFVYRIPLDDDVEGVYLSPLLFAHRDSDEIVVTPAYFAGDEWKGDAEIMFTRFGLICWFMQQTVSIVTEHREHVSSVVGRKKVTKAKSIRVVTLRPIEHTVQPSASEQHSVDWTCRWEVREHQRRLKDGRTIAVRKHEKGPKDKPLRIPEKVVYDISR